MNKQKVKKTKSSTTKQTSLSMYFASMISMLIALIIIITSGYVFNHIQSLSVEYSSNLNTFNSSFSTLIGEIFDENYNKGRLEKATEISELLKKQNKISYAYAIDKATNKVFWTTSPSILNKDGASAKGDIFFQFQAQQLMEGNVNKPTYDLIVGIPVERIASTNINNLLDKMKIFIVIAVFFSIIASAIMSRFVLKPLNQLTLGVKQFAKGNFNFNFKETRFSEINELVNAYNKMARQLLDLYTSLEQKVQERTVALEKANNEIKETQAMMVHSEKMRSLGELVAGIAHEVNNPINFIHGNIMILNKYVKDIFELVDTYTDNESSIPEAELEKIKKIKKTIDIEFIRDDVVDLIKSCIEGTERTKNIVLDLKNFSRMDEMVLTEFDIPKEIDTTLNILNNSYKNRIDVIKEYEDDLPRIEAFGGQLNQVFMNILDNAQYAVKGEGSVKIQVKTQGNNVIIKFTDSGEGIKQEDLNRVFEPFYTTKPVGEGTGMGMSITYRVVKNHNGDIKVSSEQGKGTTFTLTLPINHKREQEIVAGNSQEQIQ